MPFFQIVDANSHQTFEYDQDCHRANDDEQQALDVLLSSVEPTANDSHQAQGQSHKAEASAPVSPVPLAPLGAAVVRVGHPWSVSWPPAGPRTTDLRGTLASAMSFTETPLEVAQKVSKQRGALHTGTVRRGNCDGAWGMVHYVHRMRRGMAPTKRRK
jgi:hypothetical protein